MMTTGALIAELKKRDPEGRAQIFIRDENGSCYYDIDKVNGFTNTPDSVIEAGGVLCTGS